MRFGLIDVFGSGPWTAKVKDIAVISARLQTWLDSKVGLGSRTYGIEIRIWKAKIIFSVNIINNFSDRLW